MRSPSQEKSEQEEGKGRGSLACPRLRWWLSFSFASVVCQSEGDFSPGLLARVFGRHWGQQPLLGLWLDLQLGSVHLALTWADLRYHLCSYPERAFGVRTGFHFKAFLTLKSSLPWKLLLWRQGRRMHAFSYKVRPPFSLTNHLYFLPEQRSDKMQQVPNFTAYVPFQMTAWMHSTTHC